MIDESFICKAIQRSDQMVCDCGNVWDINDPHPPECQKMTEADNIRMFTGITPNSFEPDIMLKMAQGRLKVVVIVGYDEDGNLFFSSSESSGPEVLWLFELAKNALINV